MVAHLYCATIKYGVIDNSSQAQPSEPTMSTMKIMGVDSDNNSTDGHNGNGE